MARVRTKLLIGGAAVLFAAGIAEIVLRVAGEHAPPTYPPVPFGQGKYREFEHYGYALNPSAEQTYDYPRFDPRYPDREPRRITLRSDSFGFRSSRELSEEDRRPRILVVGDSYVFGQGVEESERFTNLLEQREPGWRVDNVAIPGWGPDLMLMALEEVLGMARPDFVVFSLSCDQFRRVRLAYQGMGYEIPRLRLVGGELRRVPYPVPPLWERTHLFWAVLRMIDPHARPYSPLDDAEFELNRAILGRFLQLASTHGFQPVFAYVPSPWADERNHRRRGFLRDFAADNGVPLIDLTDAIHGADQAAVYIPDNTHYAPGGNRIVAEQYHRFFRTRPELK